MDWSNIFLGKNKQKGDKTEMQKLHELTFDEQIQESCIDTICFDSEKMNKEQKDSIIMLMMESVVLGE